MTFNLTVTDLTFLLSIIIFSVFFLSTFAFVVELRFVDRRVYIIVKRIYTNIHTQWSQRRKLLGLQQLNLFAWQCFLTVIRSSFWYSWIFEIKLMR